MTRIITCVLATTLGALLACCGRPQLVDYQAYFRFNETAEESTPGLWATFFGVSTIALTDGETTIMSDGFFTRPASVREQTPRARISPSPKAIVDALARARVNDVDALYVLHSHYDHSLDSPEVARRTGALVYGSESTHMVCKGWGLPDNQFRYVKVGEPQTFGRFKVTAVVTRHAPFLPFGSTGEPDEGAPIAEPIVPPARLKHYLQGENFSLLVSHPWGNTVIHGSAGLTDGAFDGYDADVIFLGIGKLGNQTPTFRELFFEGTVQAVGATRIVPIHWDDYTLPLDEPLRPMRRLLSDFRDGMDFLLEKAAARPGTEVRLMQSFQKMLLYEAPAQALAKESRPE